MNDVIAWILAAAAWLVRFALILVGLIAVPLSLVGGGENRTPAMWRLWGQVADIPDWWYLQKGDSRWSKFWWMAVRNPTLGLTGMFKQPAPETKPNPDDKVRSPHPIVVSAHRYTRHGLFVEYWYLRRVGEKFFEFRIGWKFVDGNDEFFPTFQFRIGS